MHCKIDGKDYDEMFELCEKLLSDDRRKAKFLKGIPLYDPSTVEGEWVEPDDKSPFERIKNEIFKWNRKDYAKQIILAIATLQISHQW